MMCNKEVGLLQEVTFCYKSCVDVVSSYLSCTICTELRELSPVGSSVFVWLTCLAQMLSVALIPCLHTALCIAVIPSDTGFGLGEKSKMLSSHCFDL